MSVARVKVMRMEVETARLNRRATEKRRHLKYRSTKENFISTVICATELKGGWVGGALEVLLVGHYNFLGVSQ